MIYGAELEAFCTLQSREIYFLGGKLIIWPLRPNDLKAFFFRENEKWRNMILIKFSNCYNFNFFSKKLKHNLFIQRKVQILYY